MLALLVAFAWGFNFIVGKAAVAVFPPIFYAMLRMVVVMLCLLPWLKPLKGQMPRLIAIAMTAGVLNFGLMLIGFSMTDHVGPVAVALQINIPMMVVMAVLFLGERIGPYRIIAIIVAFAGVLIIGFDPRAFTDPWAFLVVCGSGTSFGVSVILMRGLKGGHPMQVQAWLATLSIPVLLAYSLVMETGQLEQTAHAGWYGAGLVLYAAFAATMIGHGGMFFLLQRYPVNYMVPFLIAPPVIGVLFGIWLYDDPVTWKIALGGVMTIGGVAVIQVREALKARRTRTVETST